MNNRRDFIKKVLTAGAVISYPKIMLAADYSIKNNPDQKKYIYNPFEGTNKKPVIVKKQENIQITNKILPQNEGQKAFWDRPREIYLHRTQTGENARIVYFENGRINEQGYKLACYLLRDVKQGQVINMDLQLLDLICAVQAWLNYYGFTGPIRVTSGFRSSKTNSGLEGAAKNSMHLYGRAIDFTVPGLSPAALAQIASQFKAGGIGIYLSQNFIHLDTGGVRVWVKK